MRHLGQPSSQVEEENRAASSTRSAPLGLLCHLPPTRPLSFYQDPLIRPGYSR